MTLRAFKNTLNTEAKASPAGGNDRYSVSGTDLGSYLTATFSSGSLTPMERFLQYHNSREALVSQTVAGNTEIPPAGNTKHSARNASGSTASSVRAEAGSQFDASKRA
ncbi:hypothetical protein RUND412_006561 [Rhizina undulata]